MSRDRFFPLLVQNPGGFRSAEVVEDFSGDDDDSADQPGR